MKKTISITISRKSSQGVDVRKLTWLMVLIWLFRAGWFFTITFYNQTTERSFTTPLRWKLFKRLFLQEVIDQWAMRLGIWLSVAEIVINSLVFGLTPNGLTQNRKGAMYG